MFRQFSAILRNYSPVASGRTHKLVFIFLFVTIEYKNIQIYTRMYVAYNNKITL